MGILGRIIKEVTRPIDNKIKGVEGERKVNSKLNPVLFGKVEHKQINNIILLDDNGISHQIDHVEIRANGIFCIETKNYSGAIYGGENGDKWYQYIGNEKNSFLNPIKQNRSHIYHLQKALNNKYKVHSVIVLARNNANKINVPYVVNLDDLRSYLMDFSDGRIYSADEMEEIYNTLISCKASISNREHVKKIKEAKKNDWNVKCPYCGGMLVRRKGTSGEFYGCSNYPKCRYTKNI